MKNLKRFEGKAVKNHHDVKGGGKGPNHLVLMVILIHF
jgi:hypothetical protein